MLLIRNLALEKIGVDSWKFKLSITSFGQTLSFLPVMVCQLSSFKSYESKWSPSHLKVGRLNCSVQNDLTVENHFVPFLNFRIKALILVWQLTSSKSHESEWKLISHIWKLKLWNYLALINWFSDFHVFCEFQVLPSEEESHSLYYKKDSVLVRQPTWQSICWSDAFSIQFRRYLKSILNVLQMLKLQILKLQKINFQILQFVILNVKDFQTFSFQIWWIVWLDSCKLKV